MQQLLPIDMTRHRPSRDVIYSPNHIRDELFQVRTGLLQVVHVDGNLYQLKYMAHEEVMSNNTSLLWSFNKENLTLIKLSKAKCNFYLQNVMIMQCSEYTQN